MIASSGSSRNRRGLGFPLWGRGVTLPTSTKPNPKSNSASTATPSLSKPAARPNGDANVFPQQVLWSARRTSCSAQVAACALRSSWELARHHQATRPCDSAQSARSWACSGSSRNSSGRSVRLYASAEELVLPQAVASAPPSAKPSTTRPTLLHDIGVHDFCPRQRNMCRLSWTDRRFPTTTDNEVLRKPHTHTHTHSLTHLHSPTRRRSKRCHVGFACARGGSASALDGEPGRFTKTVCDQHGNASYLPTYRFLRSILNVQDRCSKCCNKWWWIYV